jgi:hypothetical protein
MTAFTKGEVIAYNCYSEFLQIASPERHISSIQVIKALANWHWTYLEEKR